MTKIVAAFARPSTGRTELSASGMVWLQNAILSEFESPHRSGGGRPPVDSRGVAQPGRAPGSGPGGRRFESSRPDQFSPDATRDLSVPSSLGVACRAGRSVSVHLSASARARTAREARVQLDPGPYVAPNRYAKVE